MAVQGTPTAQKASRTWSASSAGASNTRPSSSEKRTDRGAAGCRGRGHAQPLQLHLDAAVPGEGHLQEGRDEAAVAPVVAGGKDAVIQEASGPFRRLPSGAVGSSTSGDASPTWPNTWARAEPPSRFRLPPRSTKKSRPLSGSFRSGVRVLVMSGQVT